MEQKETVDLIEVPYVAYESAMYYGDKKNKRLWGLAIALIALMVGKSVCEEVLFLKRQDK